MKIKGILAGLTAASIAATTVAAVSASAAAAPLASPAAGTKLAKENAKSVIARSVNTDITDGSLSLNKDNSLAIDPVESDIPLMLLVVDFPNVKYDTTHDWGEATFSGDYSLSQFYTDMSGGKFTFVPVEETSVYDGDLNLNEADKENDGVVHVTVSQEHGNWASLTDDEAAIEYLTAFKEAIEMAGQYVDYAKYDTNGNGMIETNELSVGIVVAGYEGSYTGDNEGNDDFWAHSWSFADAADAGAIEYPEVNGVKLNKYIGIGEKFSDDLMSGVNVLTHELGHYLGLLDYYDVDYYDDGEWYYYTPGYFSPMDSGEWGVAEDRETYCTFAMDMLSKMILGWSNYEVVSDEGTYELVAEDYTVDGTEHKSLVIPTANPGEYYLLEIRNNNKWDAGMKYAVPEAVSDGGIVIYHVDENVWDEPSPRYGGSYTNGEANSINVPVHRPGFTTLNLEVDDEGYPTMIGELVADNGIPNDEGDSGSYLINVYSKSMWNNYCADTMGNTLNLPLYGTGDQKDIRAARTLSGINIEFLDDVGETMHVKISYTEPEQPVDSSEPDSSSEPEPETSSVTETSSNDTTSSKITDTAVANTGAGAGLGAVAAVVAGAVITVVSRKRKED